MPSNPIFRVCAGVTATTDIKNKYFDWAMKTSHMWLYVIKQTWHHLHSRGAEFMSMGSNPLISLRPVGRVPRTSMN